MKVDSKNKSYINAVIFSGIKVNEENLLPQAKQVSNAQKTAFSNLKSEYEEQKLNSSLSYGKFLKCVEINLSKFKNPETSSNVRSAVANKLQETANLHKTQKEANFGKIHLFFHKLWQGCIGHGFQTKGDYGLQLAAKLTHIEKSIWKQELKNFIQKNKQDISPEKLIIKINQLDKAQFEECLKIYARTPESYIGDKLKIYNGLTQEKKVQLTNNYVDWNWYIPVFNILRGANNEEREKFISDKMIDHFRNNLQGFFHVWSYQRHNYKDQDFDNFVELIIIRGYKKCIEENNIKAINELLLDREFGKDVQIILKNHGYSV